MYSTAENLENQSFKNHSSAPKIKIVQQTSSIQNRLEEIDAKFTKMNDELRITLDLIKKRRSA